MSKKIKSTVDKFLESLGPEERKQYDEEYRELLLSELILAAMAKDNISVKRLAKMAGYHQLLCKQCDQEKFRNSFCYI